MDEAYSVVEGRFGTVEVREISHNLITHAHAQMQFGYWIGGGTAHASLSAVPAQYNDAFVVSVNRYQSHDFILDDAQSPAFVLFLYIHQSWLDDVQRKLSNPVVLTQSQIKQTAEMRLAAWQLMQKTMLFQNSESQSIEEDVLNLLRLTLAEAAQQMLPLVWPKRRKLIDYRLRLALTYMQDHAVSDRSISEVAKLVGLSRSRLYELFQTELSSSPQVIWNSMRMKRAKQDVGVGEDDLATVASSLGFSTAGNFSRFFRSIFGLSPLEYRKGNLRNQQRGAQMLSVAYTSYASQALTQQDLEQILKSARLRNSELNVTGVLLYVGGCFMQYLEGAQRDLYEVLEFVVTATQHHQIRMGEFVPLEKRIYPDFSMAFMSTQLVDPLLELNQPEMRQFLAMGRASEVNGA